VGNQGALGGFLQGNGASSGGTFSSGNTLDFNLEGPSRIPASLSAQFSVRSRLFGTLTYPGEIGTGTFDVSYDPDYERAPSTAVLAGSYTGRSSSSGITVTMNIAANGVLSGSSGGGCGFSGFATPRTNGNAYAITLTFGGAPCAAPGLSMNGVALLDQAAGSLLAVGLTGGRDEGFVFLGTRPGAAAFGASAKSAPGKPTAITTTPSGEPFVFFPRR
jgi:hypothetical protein